MAAPRQFDFAATERQDLGNTGRYPMPPTGWKAETDRYWNAIVGNGGKESFCGWCKDRWGLNRQITPRVLTETMAAGGAEAKRAFVAMMEMGKIDVAKIKAACRG